ncbi:hypothetical protein RGR602_CH04008 [Rhizobium gallicum bv. gallicum R602sp]|uniref:Uncharacterized protein n=1 Tax=Rhizobium gallicum bv. gallicum R602sp TaxID=1041138 RepID=A0A0B4X5C1_9HYPH|nr:hypothetical protein RGR602_CH04008 [Rhizobium gallicum bv. gallicum R602sp]
MILAFPVQGWKLEENRIATGKSFNGSPLFASQLLPFRIPFDIENLLISIG